MKFSHLSIIAVLCTAPAFSAVLYDFESASYVAPDSNGNPTPLPSPWTQTSVNPLGVPLSYTENWTNVTGGTGTKAGAIGTAYINSSDATTSVYAPVTGSILNEKITTTIAITDSVADFPTRDTFGMQIRGTGNSDLATLTFTPQGTNMNDGGGYMVSYTTSTGVVQVLGTLQYSSEYNFSLTFLASGVELHYAPADNSSSNTVYFLPTGYDSSTSFQDIGFSMTQTGDPVTEWGQSSNFMRFDNITETAVPEASTLALAGVAALGFLRRRRA